MQRTSIRYVNPNAGLRVGDWKLLVDCFNTTTLAPTGTGSCKYGLNCSGIMLYNIAEDVSLLGAVSFTGQYYCYAAFSHLSVIVMQLDVDCGFQRLASNGTVSTYHGRAATRAPRGGCIKSRQSDRAARTHEILRRFE